MSIADALQQVTLRRKNISTIAVITQRGLAKRYSGPHCLDQKAINLGYDVCTGL